MSDLSISRERPDLGVRAVLREIEVALESAMEEEGVPQRKRAEVRAWATWKAINQILNEKSDDGD